MLYAREPLVQSDLAERMTKILRDPLWQFVAVVLAVLAIIISVLLQRRKKALSYEIVSKTPVLSTAEEIAGKLQIRFQGESVQGVYLLVIRIINTGNIPIASSDYERPLSIHFYKETRVLTGEVSQSDPININAQIEVHDQSILIMPVLLNKGDSITIKALVSNYSCMPKFDGRIIGVKNISPRTDTGYYWASALMIAGLVLAGIGFTSGMKGALNGCMLPSHIPSSYTLMISMGYSLMLGSTFMLRPYRRFLKRLLKFMKP